MSIRVTRQRLLIEITASESHKCIVLINNYKQYVSLRSSKKTE